MSYLQITAFQPSLSISNRYKSVHGSSIKCIAPVNIFNLHKNSLKPTVSSSKKCTELMKHYTGQRTGASRYQQCTPVCLFGGKGESKNGNEGSPWKSIEKVMSSFKKEQSLENVLRQQMEKQDYSNGGSGGNPPGGGGSGGGGFGGTEDEGFAALWDEILQVTLAILALLALYLYVIAGDQVVLFLKDTFEFLSGKKGPVIKTIMYEFARFYQTFRAKAPYDPYWLEKAIISTTTYWDSPKKYRRLLKSYKHNLKSASRAKSVKRAKDTDTDDKTYSDDTYNNTSYSEDSDDNEASGNSRYNDGYSEDVKRAKTARRSKGNDTDDKTYSENTYNTASSGEDSDDNKARGNSRYNDGYSEDVGYD